MRILLTGVTGQIGSALVSSLSEHGHIIAADRGVLDLAKSSTISNVLDELRPDLIVNPAAYTKVDAAEQAPDEAFAINAEAVAAIGIWANSRAVPVIHFSTDYVYQGSGSQPWSEDDPTAPHSIYARSKLAGEDALRKSGAPHLIVRTSWVYSAAGKSFLGTIGRAAMEQRDLRVVADQTGAPTSAMSVSTAVAKIIGQNRDILTQKFRSARGLVHVAAAGYVSWHGFASAIIDGLRCRDIKIKCQTICAVSTREYASAAERPHNSRLSLHRLSSTFGITMPHWQLALEPELDILATLLQKEQRSDGTVSPKTPR